MQLTEPQITDVTAAKLGLTSDEFEKIKEILGRTPNFVELSTYAVMWSEQRSFKNSIKWLNTLPREGSRLIGGTGEENTSLVDIGDGLACTFKIEPHNHLSPISVGIVRMSEIVSAYADGPGNPVFIMGSRTRREGIEGETFAAAKPYEERHEGLSVMEAGTPFQEKMLLEARLEAIKTGAVVGLKDIGSAGIVCATADICAKSGTGMRIDLSKVPTRQANMEAWEILLSESQGRMLIVGKKGQEPQLFDVFEKLGLECIEIGEVTDTGILEYFYEGEKIADIPAKTLVLGGTPVYERDYSKPVYMDEIGKFRLNKVEMQKDFKAAARKLFSMPGLVAKRWKYEQFDRIESNMAYAPSDAAVIKVEGSRKSLVVTMGCNAAYVLADPYVGTMIAVAEAARNITCTGGLPIATTNCLNFGNPYDPAAYYQFVYAIKGMGEACRKFNTPVAGGYVGFYNQHQKVGKTESIPPKPTIGMLGIMEDASHQTTLNFKAEGDVIYMLGNIHNDLNSSEYLRNVLGVKYSPAPVFDLHEEFELQQLVRQLTKKKWLCSLHDVSEGGLFTNLMESAVSSGLGFNIETMDTFRKDCFLFGESQSRVVLAMPPDREDEFQTFLVSNNVSFTKLGEVFGTEVVIDNENFGSVAEWSSIFDNTLGEKFDN